MGVCNGKFAYDATLCAAMRCGGDPAADEIAQGQRRGKFAFGVQQGPSDEATERRPEAEGQRRWRLPRNRILTAKDAKERKGEKPVRVSSATSASFAVSLELDAR